MLRQLLHLRHRHRRHLRCRRRQPARSALDLGSRPEDRGLRGGDHEAGPRVEALLALPIGQGLVVFLVGLYPVGIVCLRHGRVRQCRSWGLNRCVRYWRHWLWHCRSGRCLRRRQRWHGCLRLRHGALLEVLVLPLLALVQEVGKLHVYPGVVVAVWPTAETIAHQAHVETLLLAVSQHLVRLLNVVGLQSQPQGQARGQPRVVPAERCGADQAQGALVRDVVVGDVYAVHGEGLRLGVEVLDQRVHDRVVQHVPVGLHNHAWHPVVPQHTEELVQTFRADDIIGEVHVGAALPHVGEVGNHHWQLLVQPVAESQQRRVAHGWLAVLDLDVDLPLPHHEHPGVPDILALASVRQVQHRLLRRGRLAAPLRRGRLHGLFGNGCHRVRNSLRLCLR
mmetsp:Transcript_60077/g.178875  ORF Transcript_60077/g.178875 Transcript_60077/m.178875 type:complete len:394 (+) Transcript_60077:685-1866(+)